MHSGSQAESALGGAEKPVQTRLMILSEMLPLSNYG